MRDAWMRTGLLLCGVVGMAAGSSQAPEDIVPARQAGPPVPHETFDTP
ncbi:hypothetical protein [Polyangium mundeleinium]|uniref:Uncharacterized protein n=1 Tax=Polyangium mundeleinium TaxID=2995306 RepID=A0ABT5F0T4_9BACT|nr:hypothetical protein [Polyangium mundeleinium]MDC0746787.1 hypothetical protein [Polyangium mundeleinium]